MDQEEKQTLTFAEKKQYWESIESPTDPPKPTQDPQDVKEKRSQIPVPKQRPQKPSAITEITPKSDSFETQVDSKDSKTVQNLEKQDSILSQQESNPDEEQLVDTVTGLTEQEQLDEDELNQAKFYIGEKSDNIITKSMTERRSDFAFDNEGYRSTQDSATYEEDLLIDNETMKPSNRWLNEDKSEFEGLEKEKVERKKDATELLMASIIEDVCEPKEMVLSEVFEEKHHVIHTPTEPRLNTEVFDPPATIPESRVSTAQAIIAVEVERDLEMSTKLVSLENLTEVSDTFQQHHVAAKEDLFSLRANQGEITDLVVEQTLNEVKDSIDAIQEELIEVVKDGKLIKESPSEFEFKVLSQVKYSEPIIELSNEDTAIVEIPPKEKDVVDRSQPKEMSFVKVSEIDIVKHEVVPASPQLSSNESSYNTLDIKHRKFRPNEAVSNRLSLNDPENYSSSDQSHYQSFDRSESRPLSSDMENYLTSEYQTAVDNISNVSSFKIGSTTEYLSAVNTFDSTSKTISSRESMKSLDSESSGNLGSLEMSDTSETLIPSTMDIEIEGSDLDVEEDEDEKYGSLEEKGETILLEFDATERTNVMKRSQEMTFQPEPTTVQLIQPIETTEPILTTSVKSKLGDSVEDMKFASSLEDGSILSVSLSSTSYVDTIVEYQPEESDIPSLSGSLVGSYEMTGNLNDEVVLSSYEKGLEYPFEVEDQTVMTKNDSRILSELEETSGNEASSDVSRKSKGHKRNESTSFATFTAFEGAVPTEAVDVDELNEEVEKAINSKSLIDEKKDSESDSEYDRYETEYSRAFKLPSDPVFKGKRQSELKTIDFDKDKDIRRSRSPSQSMIEPILEDITAESEHEEQQIRKVIQTLQDYNNVPDITITDDPNKYVSDSDEEIVLQEQEPERPIQSRTEVAQPVVLKESHITQQTTTLHYAQESEFKMSEEQYESLIEKQYQSKISDQMDHYEKRRDSPESDSFEMLEQPDLSDEFVIIEEVAKEANELDMEGKSLRINKTKYIKKHDDEVEKMVVKSAPADPHEGSILYGKVQDEMGFEFEESPPQDDSNDSGALSGQDADYNKRWVEMQLAESQNLRYPYEIERGILEDIKEEDTDMEVGSSRISSFKDSFSSTPDYDLNKKHHAREHDDISMNSLQEFESLEQAISFDRKQAQGSLDSLSNGSFPKRYLGRDGDGISLSSLKEFEGIENACLEAHLLEIKAKEEAALLLSRSDESNKSDESGKIKIIKSITTSDGKGTTTTTVTKAFSTTGDSDGAMFKALMNENIQMVGKEKFFPNVMETSAGSADSLNIKHASTSGKDNFRRDSLDSLDTMNKSVDLMTSSIDSIEAIRDGRQSSRSDVDSLERMVIPSSQSIDSIEFNARPAEGDTLQTVVRTVTTTTVSSGPTVMMHKEISSDSLNSNANINLTEQELHYLTSSESMDSSSTATNATYRNASGDSQMSGSITSCDSNTMIDTLDNNFVEMYGGGPSYSSVVYDDRQQVASTTTASQSGFEISTVTTSTVSATTRLEKHDLFDDKF